MHLVATDPDFRRLGLARATVSALLDHLTRDGGPPLRAAREQGCGPAV
ncbi:hypothetical protein [Streptomyces sp. NPDC003943]